MPHPLSTTFRSRIPAGGSSSFPLGRTGTPGQGSQVEIHELSAPGHGVPRVDDEIHQDLIDLIGSARTVMDPGRLRDELDVLPAQRALTSSRCSSTTSGSCRSFG